MDPYRRPGVSRRRLKGDPSTSSEAVDSYLIAERQAWESFAAETQLVAGQSAEDTAREVAIYADHMLEEWRNRFSEEIPTTPEDQAREE